LITIILDLPYEQVNKSRVLENTEVEWDKTWVKLCFSHSKVSASSIGLLKNGNGELVNLNSYKKIRLL